MVVDSEPSQPAAKTATSPVKITVSQVWNSINGTDITADGLLKAGDQLTSDDASMTGFTSKNVTDLLTGPEGQTISAANLAQLQNALPGKTSALVGTKTYTTADGNNYYYEFWLSSVDGTNATYGSTVSLNYTASLKWKSSSTSSDSTE